MYNMYNVNFVTFQFEDFLKKNHVMQKDFFKAINNFVQKLISQIVTA